MTSTRQETAGIPKAVRGGPQRERRSCTRFHLKGDAWFQWATTNGLRGEGEGVTRDVGKGGAFIETANMPPVAAQVSVVVTLRGRVSEDMEARLCGVGWVRHVLREEGVVVGFGAGVLFHTEAPAQAG